MCTFAKTKCEKHRKNEMCKIFHANDHKKR